MNVQVFAISEYEKNPHQYFEIEKRELILLNGNNFLLYYNLR